MPRVKVDNRNGHLIAPCHRNHAPPGRNLSTLPPTERRSAWADIQSQCPEFAAVVTAMTAAFGRPGALHFTNSAAPEAAEAR